MTLYCPPWRIGFAAAGILLLSGAAAFPSDRDTDLAKSASMSAGKISNTEKTLYQDSIQSTKQSTPREKPHAF